jgi:hypothetical protein
METMTYASVATLPWSIAQNKKHPVVLEAEFTPLDLSRITRKWIQCEMLQGSSVAD